jgi:CHASE3 domain sensor protein
LAKAGKAVEALGVIKSNKGRDLMRDIRTALDEFDGDETNIENARNNKAALLRSVLLLVTVIAGVLAATVAILVGFTMRRQSANCGC